jgi:peptidoglycan/LPS O-acetylase OafA/YrhL
MEVNGHGRNGMPDYASYLNTKYFGSLNGLRCLCILLVLFSHTVAGATPGLEAIKFGAVGVRIFFVISGFLITTLLLREKRSSGAISLRLFYIRRVLRIFPLYFLVLFTYTITALHTQKYDPGARLLIRYFPLFLIYAQNVLVLMLKSQPTILFALAWSLATEEQFYSVWPFIEKTLAKRRVELLLLVTITFLSFLYLGGDKLFGPIHSFWRSVADSLSLEICLGVGIAHILNSPIGFKTTARLWTSYNSTIALTLLAAAIALQAGYFILAILCALLVLTCVQCENHALAQLLQFRPIANIGVVSYCMYLIHLLVHHPVLILLRHVWRLPALSNAAASFVITLIVTYFVSRISFTYYEGYFLRKKHLFEIKAAN